MNFNNIKRITAKKLGSALMQMALITGSLSAHGTASTYYTGRRGNYSARRNPTYLIDEGLRNLSRDLLRQKQALEITAGVPDNRRVDDVYVKAGRLVRELVIVDRNVKGYHQFSSLARPGIVVVEIPEDSNGLDRLIQILAQYSNLEAVHLFSHATAGQLLLGSNVVGAHELKTSPQLLQTLNGAVKEGGDFLLYGCELGKGTEGEEFLEIVKASTHVDVAASNDLTGHVEFNGNWDLEIQKGDINTTPVEGSIALKDFTGVMQFTGTIDFSQYKSGSGAYNDPPFYSLDAQFYESASNNYLLTVNGATTGTYQWFGSGYVVNAMDYETSITLEFTNGETFTPNAISLYNFSGTNRTFYITTNLGGNVSSASLPNLAWGYGINLNALPDNVTSVTITGSQPFWVGIDDFVVTDLQSASDNTPPVVSSITVSGSPAANASSMVFTVAFDENANNVSTDDFQVTTASGTATGTVSSVSASTGTSINVTVNSITGTGSIRLDLNSSTNITDDSGNGNGTNGFVAAHTSGSTHTVDRDAPSAPSTPDLAAGSDTGTSSTDNLTADNTPTFTGTAEANSTVTVISSVDGTLGTTTADGTGNWSFTSGAITSGAHTITATATDAAGNTSAASSGLVITIDTTSPSAPSTPDLAAGSDTGTSSTDNITADNTPTITGTAEANAIVTVISSVDGTLGTTTADGTGNWSFTSGAITSAAHTITATATDAAGNTSAASSGLVITIDTTSPSAPSTPDLAAGSDTGTSSTDNITADNTPTITGTSEANAIITVISSVDGTLGTTTADGTGNWSFTSGAITSAAHTITATATDAAGNTSAASSGLAITIDTTSPSAPSTPDLTAGSDTGTSSTDNLTADNTPTITGTSEANAIITVISSVDGTLGTTTADGTGNWSFTSGAITSATHTITATATDAAGNTSAASSGLAITIDTTSPSAPSTPDLTAGSDTGTSSIDNLTADNTPTFTGTAEANSTVTVISSVDGTLGTTTADGTGNWSFTSGAITSAVHTITATATDAAGNTSAASSGLAITVDTTSPSAPSTPDLAAGSDTGTSSTDNLTADNTPTIIGTAEANSTVTVISSVDGMLGTAAADGTGNWSFTSGTISSSIHTITATATDAAGNTSAASSGLAITVDTTSPSAPSTPDLAAGSDTGTSSTDNITADNTPTLTGTAEANAIVTVISSVDGTLGTTTADGTGNWSFTSGAITSAAHTITATATDAAGNTGAASSGLGITIDITSPTISGLSPLDEATNVALNTNLVITFNENVSVGSGNLLVRRISDDATVQTIAVTDGTQVSASGNVLTVNPTSDFPIGEALYINIAAGLVTDIAGNSVTVISDNSTWNFSMMSQIGISVNDPSITEGNSGTIALTFTVSLSQPAPAGGATVDFATSNGTANAGSDYTSNSGTLTYAVGEMTKTVDVIVLGDNMLEGDETITLTLTNETGTNVIISDATGTGTIFNDDAAAVTIDDVSENEDDGAITVTATLDNAVQGGFTVEVSTADGTATVADNDYTSVTSQTLTFVGTAGETQTFSVLVTTDTKMEANETLTISQANLGATTLSVSVVDGATITIFNDDAAAVTIDDISGNEDDGAITVTATLDNAVQGGFTVEVSTADGTATVAGSDYTPVTNQTLTFVGTSGETQTFTVTPTVDSDPELNETINVSLGNLASTSLSVNIVDDAVITIIDDDAAQISISDANVLEGASGTVNLTFTVTLDKVAPATITVDFSTSDGTSTAGSDYTAVSGTVTFAAGETSKTIDIVVAGDDIVETDETLTVTLSNSTGPATLADGSGTGTITDDDAAMVTIADASGPESGGVITVTATLDHGVQGGFTVEVSTADGTATLADNDYTAISNQTLTFAGTSGETQTFTINPIGDSKVETDETITIAQANLAGTSFSIDITDGATITITNDDVASVTMADVSGLESDGSITVTATLDHAVEGGFTIEVSSANGTAIAGSDFVAVSNQTLTFSGTTAETQTFMIALTDDASIEGDESFTIGMNNLGGTSFTVNISDVATITINDDEVPVGEKLPQAVTPNNDGINDTWVITGIENYPNNKVTIFNRWGQVVYEASGYDNTSLSFRGVPNRNNFGDKNLPDGSYFYVIDLGDGEVKKGYLVIKN